MAELRGQAGGAVAVEIEPQGVVPGLFREQRDDLIGVAPGVLEPLQHQDDGGVARHVARLIQQRARRVPVDRLGRYVDRTDEGRVDLVASEGAAGDLESAHSRQLLG